jgi:hypothetical protein
MSMAVAAFSLHSVFIIRADAYSHSFSTDGYQFTECSVMTLLLTSV